MNASIKQVDIRALEYACTPVAGVVNMLNRRVSFSIYITQKNVNLLTSILCLFDNPRVPSPSMVTFLKNSEKPH